ncbi:unnamed protein product [Tilletia controversa]|nr:unnamed protein product [Tilletia controversa]CAD6923936.1 unnamed protein product [Tilletia controversa]CAD6936276.1 unnamed protein product [Tilletia controversa]
MSALLPPEARYSSEAVFVDAMRQFTSSKGYAFVIGSSYKDRKGLRTVFFWCDRGGTYRQRHGVNEDNRQRDRSSRLCGCNFRVKLREQNDGSYFLHHELEPTHRKHNHDLSSVMTVHPVLRKLDDATTLEIERQIAVGSTPKQTLALQHAAGGIVSLPRDIYNIAATSRRKASHCLEPPEALLAHLRSEHYRVAVRSEPVTPPHHV